jgi:DNA polymerase-1
LRGDPSDNIPGIKGIGEVTATILIKEFGSIEDIYKTLDKHPEKFPTRVSKRG